MRPGYLALVLHAHLPYVRHPEYPQFLEERWLFEALSETYLPLLRLCERLHTARLPARLTVSLSPTLTAMLEDPLLQQRYVAHLHQLLRLADREMRRLHQQPALAEMARFYQRFFSRALVLYEQHYQRDLIGAFRQAVQQGSLELMTTAATHGYLPLLRYQPGAVQAQLRVAARQHQRLFGQAANGLWLPECAYYPGLEQAVQAAGFGYVVLETHGVLGAQPAPIAGVYAPIRCANGLAVFGRDPAAARQVWSAVTGYPGDPRYRDFHRDLADTLPAAALGELAAAGPGATGFKYYRIGETKPNQAIYDWQLAKKRAALHAADFVARRQASLARALPLDRPPLCVAPYDAELFGHWWFEGVHWLEQVLRLAPAAGLETLSLGDYLQRHPHNACAQPALSSWGEQGYHQHWLNHHTDWIYPQLHQAATTMQQSVQHYQQQTPDAWQVRMLQQAGRTLLLAQASDWPFMLKTGTHSDYARRRFQSHLAQFYALQQGLLPPPGLTIERLQALEALAPLFPDLVWQDFAHP